jgi:hypothetical protein
MDPTVVANRTFAPNCGLVAASVVSEAREMLEGLVFGPPPLDGLAAIEGAAKTAIAPSAATIVRIFLMGSVPFVSAPRQTTAGLPESRYRRLPGFA